MAGPSVECNLRQQHFVLLPQCAGVKVPAARGARPAKQKSKARLAATKLRTQRRYCIPSSILWKRLYHTPEPRALVA
jgi:hypothetical protein